MSSIRWKNPHFQESSENKVVHLIKWRRQSNPQVFPRFAVNIKKNSSYFNWGSTEIIHFNISTELYINLEFLISSGILYRKVYQSLFEIPWIILIQLHHARILMLLGGNSLLTALSNYKQGCCCFYQVYRELEIIFIYKSKESFFGTVNVKYKFRKIVFIFR